MSRVDNIFRINIPIDTAQILLLCSKKKLKFSSIRRPKKFDRVFGGIIPSPAKQLAHFFSFPNGVGYFF